MRNSITLTSGLTLLCAFLLLATSSAAVEPSLQQAMQVYQKHHYADAARLLYGLIHQGGDAQAKPGAAHLGFGMACLANARCYQKLSRAATAIQLDYLKQLAAREKDDRDASRLAKLYLGRAHLAAGDFNNAVTWLQRFLKQKEIHPALQHLANIDLGVAHQLSGRPDQARKAWSGVPATSFETRAALAAGYCRAGLHQGPEKDLIDKVIKTSVANPKQADIGVTLSLLGIYAHSGDTPKGLEIILQNDLKAFSHEEMLVENKSIRFYDPMLLDYLARIFAKAATDAFQQAQFDADASVQAMALFYLSEAYETQAQLGQADQTLDAFLSKPAGHPGFAGLQKKAYARKAWYEVRTADAQSRCDHLMQVAKTQADARTLAEMIHICGRQNTACPPLVQRAANISAAHQGADRNILNQSLGFYFLARKNTEKAIAHLEASRDKAHKNRIENNPPMMLIDLAQAYYRAKQFSEALEIYFEMSKQFPAIRQIQVTLQGVYSMEQQSAGDAKLF